LTPLKIKIEKPYFSEKNEKALFLITFNYFQDIRLIKGVDIKRYKKQRSLVKSKIERFSGYSERVYLI